MRGRRAQQLLLSALALIGLASACSVRPTPVQLPEATLPSRTAPAPSPTFTRSQTLTPAAPAATAAPGGLPKDWIEYTDQSIRIALPRDWLVVHPTSCDAQAALAELKQTHPQMAGIIGSPDAMLSTTLWAFGPASNDFADNLNIRQSPLGAERLTDVQEDVLDRLLAQLGEAGFTELSSDANLRINGQPAARVRYTLPPTTSENATSAIRGHQYLVLSDSDLWILTYSTIPEREARMASIFEESARSFRPQ